MAVRPNLPLVPLASGHDRFNVNEAGIVALLGLAVEREPGDGIRNSVDHVLFVPETGPVSLF